MARENLFDQSRAGSGQAKDEDRLFRRPAGPFTLRKELRCEQLFRPQHLGVVCVCIVDGVGVAQRCAARVVVEGSRVVALVFERLAQRIVQVKPIVGRQIGPTGLGLHRRLFVGGEGGDLHICQAPVGVSKSRRQGDAPSVGGLGLLAAAHGAQAVPVVEPKARLLRIVLEQTFIQLGDPFIFAEQTKTAGQQVAVGRIFWLSRQ